MVGRTVRGRKADHLVGVGTVGLAKKALDRKCRGGVPHVVNHLGEGRGEVGEGEFANSVVGTAQVERMGHSLAGVLAVVAVLQVVVVLGDTLGDELVDGGVGLGVEVAADDEGDLVDVVAGAGILLEDALQLLEQDSNLHGLDVVVLRVPVQVGVGDNKLLAAGCVLQDADAGNVVLVHETVEDVVRLLELVLADDQAAVLKHLLVDELEDTRLVEGGAAVDPLGALLVHGLGTALGVEDAVVALAQHEGHPVLLVGASLHLLQTDDVGGVEGDLLRELLTSVLPVQRPRRGVFVHLRRGVVLAQRVVAHQREGIAFLRVEVHLRHRLHLRLLRHRLSVFSDGNPFSRLGRPDLDALIP